LAAFEIAVIFSISAYLPVLLFILRADLVIMTILFWYRLWHHVMVLLSV